MTDRIAEHYDRHAQALDRARRGAFSERGWLDRFLIAVPRGGHILDLGCGAAEPVGRYLIDHGRTVMGVDVSQRMIALARTRFPRQIWLHADMRRAIPGRSFHGILAWDSLYHLPHADQEAMIEKAGRWLEPGGAFLFNSEPEHGEGEDVADLYHKGLDPLRYRDLLGEAGMAVIAHAPDDAATGGRTVWLAHKG